MRKRLKQILAGFGFLSWFCSVPSISVDGGPWDNICLKIW